MAPCYPHQSLSWPAYKILLHIVVVLTGLWLQATVVGATPLESTAGLATVLNADGTLRADAHGSFNLRGYHFSRAADGKPHFLPTSVLGAGDEKWQDGFGLNGTNAEVKALVYSPTGELYAGGSFTTAGTAPAARIAKWDGSRWTTLGTGIGSDIQRYSIPDVVNAIAIDRAGTVYAGGYFAVAGGSATENIATWDGARWRAVGRGISGEVKTLTIDGQGNVYAGGRFSTAGGVPVSNVAKWDGTRWTALGTGLSTQVTKLVLSSAGVLYAASANYVAKWDGATWEVLGNGGFGYATVRDVVVDGAGNVYAGGNFVAFYSPSRPDVAVSGIAKWDGTRWNAVGSGIPDDVYALALDDAGNFYAAGTYLGNQVLKWNGSRWVAVTSVSAVINALAIDASGGVAVGGTFTRTSQLDASYVAKWDGTRWSNLGTGLNDVVMAVAADGRGNVYIGGSFSSVGGIAANRIAKWDGTNWSALGTGIEGGSVSSLAIDAAGNVYAGGSYNRAGGKTAISIAKWNGSSWSALGAGLITASYYYGNVYSLVIDQAGNLYAGGRFSESGRISLSGIAKWNGTSWSTLGAGFDFPVYALVLDEKGDLYAGGGFTRTGSLVAKHVAKWDGTRWSALGTGVESQVYALALAKNGTLYAGGETNSVSTTALSAWNGTSWSVVGTSFLGQVTALALDGNDQLYAAGRFDRVGTVAAQNIAKWDGSTWAPLGTGLNYLVASLSIQGSSPLCVGGYFTTVGDRSKVSAYLAMYNTGAAPLPLSARAKQPAFSVQLYPNPSRSSCVITCSAGRIEQGRLLNSRGQLIRHLSPAALQTAIDTRGLAAGVYTIQVVVKGQVLSQRLVIE